MDLMDIFDVIEQWKMIAGNLGYDDGAEAQCFA